MFPHHSIHKYTWTSPEEKTHNQIYDVLIDRRCNSSTLDVRSSRDLQRENEGLRQLENTDDHSMILSRWTVQTNSVKLNYRVAQIQQIWKPKWKCNHYMKIKLHRNIYILLRMQSNGEDHIFQLKLKQNCYVKCRTTFSFHTGLQPVLYQIWYLIYVYLEYNQFDILVSKNCLLYVFCNITCKYDALYSFVKIGKIPYDLSSCVLYCIICVYIWMVVGNSNGRIHL
jgi:hypothetical protein